MVDVGFYLLSESSSKLMFLHWICPVFLLSVHPCVVNCIFVPIPSLLFFFNLGVYLTGEVQEKPNSKTLQECTPFMLLDSLWPALLIDDLNVSN